MLRNFLQGKYFQYPLHTLLVHFPLGLFILSFLLDVIALFLRPANALVRGAFYTLAAGLGMALLAGIPGLADWNTIRNDHPGKKRATLHLIINVVAIGLYLLNFFLRQGTLGGTFSSARGLNNFGQVVGASETASGEIHAFLWQDGVMTDLGTLGSNFSSAFDINEHGQIAGISRTPAGDRHAVLWTK